MNFVDVVFDSLPGIDGCKFIELETPKGESIRALWILRTDGYYALRIPVPDHLPLISVPIRTGETAR